MNCPNVTECSCPKTTCENYKRCCACVRKHKNTDSMPHCLFPDNPNNKSLASFYQNLKERFEAK